MQKNVLSGFWVVQGRTKRLQAQTQLIVLVENHLGVLTPVGAGEDLKTVDEKDYGKVHLGDEVRQGLKARQDQTSLGKMELSL